jgi:hypothetical protein
MDNETGGCSSAEAKNEMGHINECVREIPKAPGDEGICKLCGVDKDVENVLVCDICDLGYHTYCLNPPLAKIPEENWYCPSCVSGHCITQGSSQRTEVISRCQKKRCQTEFNNRILGALAHLAATMEMKEYWEYTIEEVCPLVPLYSTFDCLNLTWFFIELIAYSNLCIEFMLPKSRGSLLIAFLIDSWDFLNSNSKVCN